MNENPYALDGLCHNAEPGTYGHECGKPAAIIGSREGFAMGFCRDCAERGAERRGFTAWAPVDPRYPAIAAWRERHLALAHRHAGSHESLAGARSIIDRACAAARQEPDRLLSLHTLDQGAGELGRHLGSTTADDPR